jgi:hypothetical protein
VNCSPNQMELTVGWRLMSDQTMLDQLEIYRGYRMFYWRPKGNQWPAPHADITAHVANMHMIPAKDRFRFEGDAPWKPDRFARLSGAGGRRGRLELA